MADSLIFQNSFSGFCFESLGEPLKDSELAQADRSGGPWRPVLLPHTHRCALQRKSSKAGVKMQMQKLLEELQPKVKTARYACLQWPSDRSAQNEPICRAVWQAAQGWPSYAIPVLFQLTATKLCSIIQHLCWTRPIPTSLCTQWQLDPFALRCLKGLNCDTGLRILQQCSEQKVTRVRKPSAYLVHLIKKEGGLMPKVMAARLGSLVSQSHLLFVCSACSSADQWLVCALP